MRENKAKAEYPEGYFAEVDDRVYEYARLHPGQHAMSRLAELAVAASEDNIGYEEALNSVRAQMGTSLGITASRTVAIRGPSPAKFREALNQK